MPRQTETELAEALRLAQIDTNEPLDLLDEDEDEDDDDSEEYLPEPPPYGQHDEDDDPDIADLNNPNVQTFGESPLLGTRTQASDLFGGAADTVGRATSPKLYAQAANFPTAVQFRVWRWENGIPVALGAIDAEASEDDFVRKFYGAMPGQGDGRFQFKFRPVDMNGRELGKEFTKNISEHHDMVARIRRQKEREREERGVQDPILINQGGGNDGAYAEEMGRMFEQAVESAERRTELLQVTLEEERDRLREEEKARFAERIAVADRSADVVQKMTERLMESDQARAKEQLQAQENQSGLLVQTLTTVFSQQQASAASQAERNRASDEVRMRQDREFFDRQRSEVEAKRKSDQAEFEMRRNREREEAERLRLKEKDDGEHRILIERERLGLEQKRIEEQRKFELEQARLDADRREKDAERRRESERDEIRRREEGVRAESQRREGELERRRESEKSEIVVRLEREKMEMERAREAAREERERWRVELDEKRRAEKEDWERKTAQQREDAERRERTDRERVERERQDFALRMERERQEREDAAQRRAAQSTRDEERRKEEARRAEEARKAEMELKLKQMEVDASRAREHQERMSEQTRLDREARMEAQTRRDSLEREAREAADRDRTRQHEFMLRQMELERESAREHQERLALAQGGGEGGGLLGGLGGIGEALGMEGPEILAKIFGAKEGEEGGWADAIPKVLGSIAELGKAAITAKAEQQQQITAKGRRRIAATPAQGQVVQTPQGPMVVMPRSAQGIPTAVDPRTAPQAQPRPFLPPEFNEYEDEDDSDDNSGTDTEGTETAAPRAAPTEPINTLARAKEAGLSLMDQKKARKAIRALGGKLAGAAQDEWLGLITQAITEEVGIYYYIKAVTVDAALAEASDNPDLQAAVVEAMRDSGLIPDDVPYTEEDYARLKALAQEAE